MVAEGGPVGAAPTVGRALLRGDFEVPRDPLRRADLVVGVDVRPLAVGEEDKREPTVERADDRRVLERRRELRNRDGLDAEAPALLEERLDGRFAFAVLVDLIEEEDDPARVVLVADARFVEEVARAVDLRRVALASVRYPLDARDLGRVPLLEGLPDALEPVAMAIRVPGNRVLQLPVEIDRDRGDGREELRGKRRLPFARTSEDPQRDVRSRIRRFENCGEVARHIRSPRSHAFPFQPASI